MKRNLAPHECAATSSSCGRRLKVLASLSLLMTLGLGCTGNISGDPSPGDGVTPGTGGSSGSSVGSGGSQVGSQGGTGQVNGGSGQVGQGGGAGPGQGGSSAGAGNQSGSGGQGAAGQGEDPYAIPATPPAAALVATPRLSRLSRQQWSNTVRDLLKLTDISDVEGDVSGDALIGFDNQADALFVTEQLRRQLADAAEKLADKVTADSAALARLVPTGAPSDTAGKGRAFITSFGLRAFRRPLTDAEVTDHLALFNQGPTLYPGVDAFKAGVSLVIQAMLQSPHFLYRTELGTQAVAGKVPLNDYELSAKLAYAVTNTMPDDELFTAAAAKQLTNATNLDTQARRLLQGSRGTAGINNFNFQMYRLGAYGNITRNTADFPDFKPNTPDSMRQEVLAFVDWVFSQGRGIKDLYTAPVGFVNSALAPLYGVSGTFTNDSFTKVDLDPNQRSGLLTQAGFLASYITDKDPDIIHRGVFIATRVLCLELPPPDPKAGKLVDLQPNMTNRERVEATTGKGTCGQSCHGALFNPLGYSLENFDALGKYRTVDHGKPVDAADSYSFDGQLKSFNNGVEMSRFLADAKMTHSCYVKNLMSYLNGRLLAAEEAAMVDYYARVSRAGMVSLRDLELAMVKSDAFVNRLP